MYNLSSTKLLLLLLDTKSLINLYGTVKDLKMHLAATIIGCRFRELIGCLCVTFGGASGSNVDDRLDSAYLGSFKWSLCSTFVFSGKG